MTAESLRESPEGEISETNRRFYDQLWADARLVTPDRFNTWPLVQSLVASARRRFEVAPGLRPRLPIAGTHFVDISPLALRALRERGGIVVVGRISALPYPDAAFDLLGALDIVEHVQDDDRALAELARVTTGGGTLLLSTPLHPMRWTAFDGFVGHVRRYEPERLLAKLAQHGLVVERSAAYGMQPRSSRLLNVGMWWLTHQRGQAMWLYNRVLMPIALRFQEKLALATGMVRTENVDEILLVCRKSQGKSAVEDPR